MSKAFPMKSESNILYEIQHRLSLLKHEIISGQMHPRAVISKIEEIEALIGEYKNRSLAAEYLILDEEDGWPD